MRQFIRSGAARSQGLWLACAAAAFFGGVALLPGTDSSSFVGGIPEVSAASTPNLRWLSERETPALASIKATAAVGSPGASGPSANIGQTIQLKGGSLAPGVASFTGYSGTPVTSTLTSVKVGKKGKAQVPTNAITGGVGVIPDGGVLSTTLPLQIVPTISTLSTNTVSAGDSLTINGTGFDPNLQVRFPGVAAPFAPSQVDGDSAVITVPAGAQKGKLTVSTVGGVSNASGKIKIAAAAFANRSLATDASSGLILATDDITNTLSAIDASSGSIVRTAPIAADAEWISFVSGSEILAIGADSHVLAYFDVASWSPVASGAALKQGAARSDELTIDADHNLIEDRLDGWSFSLGPLVEVVKRTADGRHAVAVAGDSGLLYVIDLSTRAVSSLHHFDGPVEGLTIGTDGRAYTMDRATGRLLSVDIE